MLVCNNNAIPQIKIARHIVSSNFFSLRVVRLLLLCSWSLSVLSWSLSSNLSALSRNLEN